MSEGRATAINPVSFNSITKKEARTRTRCTRQQFVQQNRDRIKPVQRLGVRAGCNAGIVIALAEVPHADLIKVMQTDCPGNTVDEDGIGNGLRDDVGEVEFQKVGIAKHGFISDVSD